MRPRTIEKQPTDRISSAEWGIGHQRTTNYLSVVRAAFPELADIPDLTIRRLIWRVANAEKALVKIREHYRIAFTFKP